MTRSTLPPDHHGSRDAASPRRGFTHSLAVILLILLIYLGGYLVIRTNSYNSGFTDLGPGTKFLFVLPNWKVLRPGKPVHTLYEPLFLLEHQFLGRHYIFDEGGPSA